MSMEDVSKIYTSFFDVCYSLAVGFSAVRFVHIDFRAEEHCIYFAKLMKKEIQRVPDALVRFSKGTKTC